MNRPNYRTKLQVNSSPAGTGDSLNKRDYPLLTVLFFRQESGYPCRGDWSFRSSCWKDV